MVFLFIAQHQRNSGLVQEFLRSQLRITPNNHYLSLRRDAPGSRNGAAGFGFSLMGYRTGIDNGYVGGNILTDDLPAKFLQLVLNRIGL